MRVPYGWLKEYVTFDLPPQELAHRLTMAGITVDDVEYLGEGIEGIIVAQIKEVAAHPNADKLVVCRVDTGNETLQIVTGAPNVGEGAKVALAPVGTILPGGMKIKKAKLRGLESTGMVCSAQELGLDPKNFPEDQQEGIIIFADDAPLGADIKQVLGLDEHVLILDLTPNRADCMALVNVAREVAAITGGEFRPPSFLVKEGTGEPVGKLASVEIKDEELCHRYAARVVRNVTIGPSPDWLKRRLQAVGVRPINNVVDVTNYIMMELGQPMHAFDYERLAEHRIIVRRAQAGEKMHTLDGEERELEESMLVIADARQPVAVAGVMGGLDSEVTGETTAVLLESAYFQHASIRRTSRALGLRSESSSRFEKGINKAGAAQAADRAARLIAELGGGEVAPGIIDAYPTPWEQPVVRLRCDRANRLLGTDIPAAEMQQMLARLTLDVSSLEGDVLEVRVPPYRGDISMEVDLIEEVARLYGYDNIEMTAQEGRPAGALLGPEQMVRDKAITVMLACGLNEILTYSFISPRALDRLLLPEDHRWRETIAIHNPLTEEQSIMRTSLLPGLLETAAKNFKRRQTNLALFETGSIFIPSTEPLPHEQAKIGAVVSGENSRGWIAASDQMDFYYLKGVCEELLHRLNIANYRFQPADDYPSLHPGRCAALYLGEDSQPAGYIGEVHPQVLDNYGIQQRTVVMELAAAALAEHTKMVPAYQPLPKFPAVVRDMAVVVRDEVSVADINEAIRAAGAPLLKDIELFDVYQGKQIAAGHRSLAYSFVYQAEDRTLTDEEVTAQQQAVQDSLQKKFAAQLR